MGKHRDRSRSRSADYEDNRRKKTDRRHSADRRHSPQRRHSPERRHHGDHRSHGHSKWEESPDRDRHDRRRDDGGHSRNRRPDYERERQKNRDRKTRRYKDDDGRTYEWGKRSDDDKDDKRDRKDKEKPNFGLSGKLAEDTNKVNGVVIKYAEPEEARIPKRRWRLYPFKGEKSLPTLYIHRQSCYLVGRDRKICDLPVDHPSCSKQHAVLQYRLVPYERKDGSEGKRVLPYVLDLESANGTFLNNKQIDPRKYYQVMEKDVLKFGFSTREYVLLHEASKDDETDEEPVEVKQEPTN